MNTEMKLEILVNTAIMPQNWDGNEDVLTNKSSPDIIYLILDLEL